VQGARELVLCLILLLMGLYPFEVADNPWCSAASSIPWVRSWSPVTTGFALTLSALACLYGRRIHWVLPLAATIHGAVWVENVERIHHVWHLPVLLAWLEATPSLRKPWIRRLTVGVWHGHAAVAKLRAHGLGWADGDSMRIWLEAFAYPWVQQTLSHIPTWVLALGQWAAIGVEAASPLAVWWPRAIGAALVAFYIMVLTTFPFGFAANLLLVWLYLGLEGDSL